MKAGWAGVSQQAKDFINGCLNVNVEERFDAQQALNNPFILTGRAVLDMNIAITALQNIKKF